MKLRNVITNREYTATLPTDHGSCSYGQEIVVADTGEVIGLNTFNICELLEATDEELDALESAGYLY